MREEFETEFQHLDRLYQVRGIGRQSIYRSISNLSQDINQDAARREFCGPDKAIPLEVMEKFDTDIQKAKRTGNRDLKKDLKRMYAKLT